MKVGVHFNFQNYTDWERFEAQAVSEEMPISDQQIYEEDLHLGGLVEPLGFDSYWCIDHHFSPYIMTAGCDAESHLLRRQDRADRLRHDGHRAALVRPRGMISEQIAVLDNMLQGRKLTLGLGRGAAKREFEAFRSPMGESRDRFMESLEVVRKASDPGVSSPTRATSTPSPKPPSGPARATRSGCSTRCASPGSLPETLEIAANAGLGMLFTNSKKWDEYQLPTSSASTRFASARAGLRVSRPSSPTWPASTPRRRPGT